MPVYLPRWEDKVHSLVEPPWVSLLCGGHFLAGGTLTEAGDITCSRIIEHAVVGWEGCVSGVEREGGLSL